MKTFHFKRKKGGFTLIELLIVIAIILILIAIALPNFLEAQIRARITKAKGEMRTLATALVSYSLDWKLYPARGDSDYANGQPRRDNGMLWLTSPIAYITSLPDDPFPQSFKDTGDPLEGPPFTYTLTGVDVGFTGPTSLHPHAAGIGLLAYMVFSAGPDSPNVEAAPSDCIAFDPMPTYSYSPTNGTKSKGDLMLMGGEGRWMGYAPDSDRACGPINRNTTPPGVVYDDVIYVGSFPDYLTIGT